MYLLLLVFSLLFIITYFFKKTSSFSLSFVLSLLTISLFTIIITEVSSINNQFNFTSSVLSWSVICIVSGFVSYKHRATLKAEFTSKFKNNTKTVLISSFVFLALLIQGMLYPPNNWDSMTYHMARITHWVMNESVYPYPTHIYRQIYQPPLAEWIIAQVCILNKSDLFANSIQLVFMCGVLAILNLIGNEFKLNKRTKITAFVLTLTTPSIILQTTSTQNDIVVGFFILSAFFFCIRLFKEHKMSLALLFGISVGCALLTKGTAFVYFIPLGLTIIFLVLKKLFQNRTAGISLIGKFLLSLVFITLIPFGHFQRNYNLSGDIFGNSEDRYFNENITIKSTIVGLVKNVGNHLSTPLTTQITNQIVEKTHLISNIPITDNKYSYNGIHFKLNNWNHNEDEVSNVFQLIFFCIVIILLILSKANNDTILVYTSLFCIITFLIFSFILKWQPWHIRLQVPLFMMVSIPISISFNKYISNTKITNVLLTISTIYTLGIIIFNPNRPFINTNKVIQTRFDKMFIAMPTFLNSYKILRKDVLTKKKKEWNVHGDTWEYPLYYDCFSMKRKPFHSIQIKNPTKKM